MHANFSTKEKRHGYSEIHSDGHCLPLVIKVFGPEVVWFDSLNRFWLELKKMHIY